MKKFIAWLVLSPLIIVVAPILVPALVIVWALDTLNKGD